MDPRSHSWRETRSWLRTRIDRILARAATVLQDAASLVTVHPFRRQQLAAAGGTGPLLRNCGMGSERVHPGEKGDGCPQARCCVKWGREKADLCDTRGEGFSWVFLKSGKKTRPVGEADTDML